MGFRLPSVMGHRGAAALAPENTLAGLRKAAELGLDWVEMDVKLTRDGVPVLFHDDLLKRTTGEAGHLADIDHDDLGQLDVGRWFHSSFAGERAPRLEDALAVVMESGLRPNVELKPSPGRDVETAVRALPVLTALWPSDRAPPMVSSFSTMALAAVRVLAPDWPRALCAHEIYVDWRHILQSLGCVSFHLNEQCADADLFDEMRDAGYGVACFTVNERRRARELRDQGVDCLITDNPIKIAEAG